MPNAANEIEIKRPADEVFAFFAPENATKWRDGVIDMKRTEGTGLGARYAQGVKGPGGRRVAADIEITDWRPPTSLAFQTIAGPVRPHGRYTFTPVDGGTRVRFELEATLGGLKRLMAPMVQRTMESEVGQLAKAKRVLESE